MREIRKSGSEGGVGFNPPFLPLSLRVVGASCSRIALGAMELEAPATFLIACRLPYFANCAVQSASSWRPFLIV
jgi:hypothetical protein